MAQDQRLTDHLPGANIVRDIRSELREINQSLKEMNRRQRDEQKTAALAAITELTDRWKKSPARLERIDELIRRSCQKAELTGGEALEIGGRDNPRRPLLEGLGFSYAALDLEERDGGLVGDITDCPHIPDGSFDLIFSNDVFEHINRPWKAAGEITRLLRPGGVVITSTLFSWRYHPCPIDYWRYTPDCLEFLFEDLETIEADWDLTERRRDIDGKGRAGALERDALGGWRENWRVYHVGRKPPTAT